MQPQRSHRAQASAETINTELWSEHLKCKCFFNSNNRNVKVVPVSWDLSRCIVLLCQRKPLHIQSHELLLHPKLDSDALQQIKQCSTQFYLLSVHCAWSVLYVPHHVGTTVCDSLAAEATQLPVCSRNLLKISGRLFKWNKVSQRSSFDLRKIGDINIFKLIMPAQ